MLLENLMTSRTGITPCAWVSLMTALEGVPAVAGVHQRVGRDAAGLHGQAGDEGLHRRAGLEDVGQRAVAQLLAGQVLAVAGVVAGVVGQRQHLAGLRVQHHHRAGLGLVLGHRVADALVGEELHLGVDGRSMSWPLAGTISPMSSTTRPRRSRTTGASRRGPAAPSEGQLDALLALVLDVGEAHHVAAASPSG
jgi:hypothetical protein